MRLPLIASLGASSLLAPALFGAVEVADDQLSIKVGMDIQTRVTSAVAHNATGGEWDIDNARNGSSNDAQFMERRARLLLDGKYGDDWNFFLSFRADGTDQKGNGNPRAVDLFKAYLRRYFKVDDDLSMYAQAGVDYPFFNRGILGDPAWLFCNMRPTVNLMGIRSSGARYMISQTWFDIGFDVMNSQDPAKPVGNANQRDGLFYSGRIEYTAFSDSGKKAPYRESFWGKPGHSLLLAADVGYDNNDYGVVNEKTNALCNGLEALFHWDGLSAIAEARWLRTKASGINGAGADTDVHSHVYLAQAGYAFPVGSLILEPALRFSKIDLDSKNGSEAQAFNSATGVPGLPGYLAPNQGIDAVNSGNMLDVGLNIYFSKVTSVQIDFSHWKGETSPADANIIRTQLQIAF